MSHSPILFYNMAGQEYLSFHDVFLKIQGQLELLKRIHLQQVTGGCHDTDLGIVDLYTGKKVDQVHAENISGRRYGLLSGSSYSHDNLYSSQRVSYDHGVRNVNLFLEYRKHQDQKTQLSTTELIHNIDMKNVNRKQMHDGESDSAEGELTCLEGETIKMREINAVFCAKNHTGGDTMGIGKRLNAGEEERKTIWNFRERRSESPHFHYQLGTGIDQKTGEASYQEVFHKRGTDDRWTDGSAVNVRCDVYDRGHARVPNSLSFRRRKRKQESEKIHRTNCDSKLSGISGLFDNSRHSKSGDVGQEEVQIECGMRGSLEQVRNNWGRVSSVSPRETDSKVSSDEELETTSREKCSSVRAGDRGKSELEATGGRESAFGHCLAVSQNDGLCENSPYQCSNRGTSEEHGSNRQTAIEPKARLGEEATPELFVVERSLACKAFACGTGEFSSGKVEHGIEKSDSIVKLEDAFAREQLENEKLRAELTLLKEKLESIMNLAEEGRSKCTYCGSIKEKLKSIELYPELKTCGVQPLNELPNNMSECEKYLEAEVTEMHGSPVGSCTNDRILVGNGLLSFEDDASLKRKRDSEQRPTGKGKDKKSKIQLDVSTVECDPVHQKRESEEVIGTSSEWAPQICIRTSDSYQAQSSKLPKPLVFEELTLEDSSRKKDKSGEALPGQLKLHIDDEEEGELDLAPDEEFGRDEFEGLAETQELHELDAFTVKDEQDEGQNFSWFCDFQDLPENMKKLADKDNEEDFADLKCGCTSQKYGDTVGVLRVYKNGKLEIYCECTAGCEKGKPMTPAAFEKHGGRGASRKWKDSIWVILGDHKVQFSKVKGLDALYRRYKTMNNIRLTQAGSGRHGYHRDEFVRCKKCQKERRFRRRNKEECRLFHDALLNPTWECSNSPFDRFMSCEDDEEREVRRAIRGCNRVRTCQGCIECVCLGCQLCRFNGCSCSICEEFMSYK